MKDDEIVQVKCNACECAIIPELHEAHSGEFEMLFFVCPYCHKKYVVSVTDTELRRSIAECHVLKEANEKDQLSATEKQRMVELLVSNRQRSKQLRELFAPEEDANGEEKDERS